MSNQLYAEWASAAGTMLLALVTVILHFRGDSYTRLVREKESHNFKKQIFNFLDITLSSGLPDNIVSSHINFTVEQYIDNFYNKLLDNKIYLNWCNTRFYKKCIYLAKDYADAWTRFPNKTDPNEIRKFKKKIIKAMIRLAPKIGKESHIQSLRESYPDLF